MSAQHGEADLPDRSHLLTEQPLAASRDLDVAGISEVLHLINDQDALVSTVVRAAIDQITRLVQRACTVLGAGGRLIYIGAGTSGRLGVLDASECPPTFHSNPDQVIGIIAGGDRALRRSSEGAEDDPGGAAAELTRLRVGTGDLLVGIAASGTTPYVLGALRQAKHHGAATALLTCTCPADRSVQRPGEADAIPCCDLFVHLPVGPEVVTGSTRLKAGSATKMVLNMISTTAFVQLGKTWGHTMVDLRATNHKLRERAIRIILKHCPSCGGSRQQAARLLHTAGGRVKLALVMARRNLGDRAAQKLLDQHEGHLRAILGPPSRD